MDLRFGRIDLRHGRLLFFMVVLLVFLALLGIFVEGFDAAWEGFLLLQRTPARLISDFMKVASIGGTLLNGALVGALGLGLVLWNRVKLSGPTFAAIFTMVGFAFFGKTLTNILPIMGGVYLAAKFARKGFSSYLIIALFGTALAPLVSFFAWEMGDSFVSSWILAILLGMAAGFLLPPVAVAMLHIHQGYNLYNVGLTCGFVGLFAASFIRAGKQVFLPRMEWLDTNPPVLLLLVPLISLFLILGALFLEGKSCWKNFWKIQKIPGRLPSDFMDMASIGGALCNAGVLGLGGSLYLYATGSAFNGPTLGGLFTVMGFGAFGTHPRNSIPVVLGVFLACLVFKVPHSAPGAVLAAIFVTTAGPLAGEFGFPVGVLAGFTHFAMVMQTGGWHGGLNLYNNGFAGGLTVGLFVAIIEWYRSVRE